MLHCFSEGFFLLFQPTFRSGTASTAAAGAAGADPAAAAAAAFFPHAPLGATAGAGELPRPSPSSSVADCVGAAAARLASVAPPPPLPPSDGKSASVYSGSVGGGRSGGGGGFSEVVTTSAASATAEGNSAPATGGASGDGSRGAAVPLLPLPPLLLPLPPLVLPPVLAPFGGLATSHPSASTTRLLEAGTTAEGGRRRGR